jgi:hypothetical protein
MRRNIRYTPLLLLILIASAAAAAGHGATPVAAAKIVPDRYIVTFKPGVEPHKKASEKARAYGLGLRHVYDSAVSGFAADVPPGQLKKLRADPDVAAIVEDREVHAFDDTHPTGIRRTQADRNPLALIGSHTNPIAVDVAVIDTGIDVNHPDLNVAGGVSCVPGDTSYDDANGHGTHVAGTIGALDNGSGVVGVAPGVRLWAVRVLDAQGAGDFADVICGIDWVTAHADTIRVANMSLGAEAPGGDCSDGGLHEAVCRSVAAGVTYVVAAGNSGVDAAGTVPASFDEVITVSAIVDTDGRPGGKGPINLLYGKDDTLASFSNFGAVVDLAAPGVGITSTYLNGGYATLDGTSMASPHVAGAAAIYLYQNPTASPAAVKDALETIAWPQNSPDGFTGDVDGFPEPLLDAGAVGGTPLPPPPPTCTLALGTGPVGTKTQVSCANFGGSEFVRIYWDSTAATQRLSIYTSASGDGTGTLTIPDATGGSHRVIALGASSGLTTDRPFTVSPSIGLSSASGKVSSNVTATLKGFGASEAVSLSWDGATVKTGTTSATGSVTLGFAVPEAVQGAHEVEVTGTTTGPVAAAYTVVPSVALSPGSGAVGTKVTVTLRGYGAGEAVDVRWFDTATASAVVGAVSTSALGSATTTFVVPDAARGAHATTGVGSGGNQASAAFTVSPSLTFTPTTAAVGDTVTATLHGFAEAEAVTVKWYDATANSTAAASATAAADGSATAAFAVPAATIGKHKVEAVGTGASTGPIGYLTVNPTLILTPSAGGPGATVNVTLAGYGAAETVTLKWYTTATAATGVATASTSATGSASASFAVPAGSPDNAYTVEGVGSASKGKATAVFTVGAAVSPPPNPAVASCTLAPASGPVGVVTRVTCANFGSSETVRIYWDSTTTSARASMFTSATGGGYVNLSIPDAVGGAHQVVALGVTSGATASQSFTVTPRFALSAASGTVGVNVTASLTGFGAGESVNLVWDGTAALKTVTVSATGSASTTLTIPEAVQGGHVVNASGANGFSATVPFAIVPSLDLSSTSGRVGTTVTVTLRGFAAGEALALRWYDAATTATDVASAVASTKGSALATFVVPEATIGGHTVEAAGSAGNLDTATFTVTPNLGLSATSGTVGTSLTVTLTGYGPSEAIAIGWYDTTSASTTVTTATASPLGSATATFAVPDATYGSHRVEGAGQASGGKASAYVSVKAGLAVTPASGPQGTTVGVALTGYRAGETVTVKWYDTASASTAVATATASPLGSATASFAVPGAAATGDHKVEGTGGSSIARATATFTVAAAATTALASNAPSTRNEPVKDNFDQTSAGAVPTGWTVAAGSADGIAITTKVRGGDGSVAFSAADTASGGAILIRDGALFDQPAVTVELRFDGEGDDAGIILGWRDAQNYVAVSANEAADQLEVWEIAGGAVRLHEATGEGSVTVKPGVRYWLRMEAGRDANGGAWVMLSWSRNGSRFRAIASVEGLLDVSGGVGLMTGGAVPPNATFDDFAASPSDAVTPLAIASEPMSTPTKQAGSAELTAAPATATASPTMEPTEQPTAEPTATASPTPEPTADGPPVEPTVDQATGSATDGTPQPGDPGK